MTGRIAPPASSPGRVAQLIQDMEWYVAGVAVRSQYNPGATEHALVREEASLLCGGSRGLPGHVHPKQRSCPKCVALLLAERTDLGCEPPDPASAEPRGSGREGT